MTERKKLGTRIREAREYLGLSQDQAAKALGIPRSGISLIESGQRRIDALELKRLSELYRRPLAFFTDEAAPEAPPSAVQYIARTATTMSEADRDELIKFAEYLQSRARKSDRP